MKLHIVAVASLLALAAATTTAGAVTFDARNTASNTAGGQRFDQDYGLDYAKHVLSEASTFTWNIFNQQSAADRKPVDVVTLIVENITGVAFTIGSDIHYSAQSIADTTGDFKTAVTGVLYHEIVHVWQWGLQDYSAHSWVFEGIADFVRLKAGYIAAHWVKPGEGSSWDQRYDVTARFLEYCDSLSSGFVAVLNAKLKDGYSDDYFVQILGKNVQQLWSDYKAKYGG
ncbi:hypothetical protein PR202_ga07424 [Eleusine coracana subsp. coracana]|uniref:Uncharacterized protein n=1 Tax=Eleusine coracana subsp. coracana TaxID=191504 RepID=A0AAV5BZY6_ELECO|nr:hypothetical protein QOZ80_2AG0111980 [Eleusine coracana subsp. coracana]GJM91083.1 hypothetical protein PR202_ga07424 [Eleusine coracana subsp. coracana]